MSKPIINFSVFKEISGIVCAIKDCFHIDIKIYHLCALERRGFEGSAVYLSQGLFKRVNDISKLEFILVRRQIPFCIEHYSKWHQGLINIGDLDLIYIKNITKFFNNYKFPIR